jgi:8-amino-7-oxononanoate synthase
MSFAKNQIIRELTELDTQLLRRKIRSVDSPCGTRIQIGGRELQAFCSNDYLGLANHPDLITALSEGAQRFGVGSGASHLISGHQTIHDALEEKLAQTQALSIPKAKALFFSTGYLANISAITALSNLKSNASKIYSAHLNHASLIDGVRLAKGQNNATVFIFDHHNLVALEDELKQDSSQHKLIIIDGVFSMDGDLAPIGALLQLAERYDALLMVDDAHGFGVLGKHGYGILEDSGLCSERLIYVGTLGKAAGLSGAFVCANELLIEWLIQKARPYIYSTASSPALAYALIRSLELIEGPIGQERRESLRSNTVLWKQLAQFTHWHLLNSDTAIQPIMIGSNETVLQLAKDLDLAGYWIPAIRPPTVPVGMSRLRMTLSAAHTHDEISALANILLHLESLN